MCVNVRMMQIDHNRNDSNRASFQISNAFVRVCGVVGGGWVGGGGGGST